jgi:hypothetical protein
MAVSPSLMQAERDLYCRLGDLLEQQGRRVPQVETTSMRPKRKRKEFLVIHNHRRVAEEPIPSVARSKCSNKLIVLAAINAHT